jgi:P27 family predicted phage terminase small subunit
MRGRKPKPTYLKVLDGNPGKRPLNDREPVPTQGVPPRPEWLDEEARTEWERIVPELAAMGLMARADRAALAAYCTAWSRWVAAEAQVRKYGTIVKSPEKGFPMKSPYLCVADQALETMRKLMVEFGLTPSSRSRIRVADGAPADDELDRFLEVG